MAAPICIVCRRAIEGPPGIPAHDVAACRAEQEPYQPYDATMPLASGRIIRRDVR